MDTQHSPEVMYFDPSTLSSDMLPQLEVVARFDRDPAGTTNNLYQHPTDQTKLIRYDGWGLYNSYAEMLTMVEATHDLIGRLAVAGVQSVNPDYIAKPLGLGGNIDMFAVVDKVDGFSLEELLVTGNQHDIPAVAYDQLFDSMLAYFQDVISEGGPVSTEMLRLEQFMYNPNDGQFTLVDVAPNLIHVISPLTSPRSERAHAQAKESLADLVRTIATNMCNAMGADASNLQSWTKLRGLCDEYLPQANRTLDILLAKYQR